ncbi:MAG: hypothetical protein V2J62_01215 [candidate division KSB1 bacterium]|nr:hypothetical protein [candidate division KSB1 bacterium]
MSNHQDNSQFIPLDEAKRLINNFRKISGAGAQPGGSFKIDTIRGIIEQKGCSGIRFYYGKNAINESVIVLVGIDEAGKDMTGGKIAERQDAIPKNSINDSALLKNE